MSTGRRFARNILSNASGYLVSIVVVFLLTPFVVLKLGDAVYGLWTLVISLTGYYGLLDLGVRAGVGQYVARYWAKRDLEGVNRTLNTAFVLLAGVAVVLMLITFVLALLLPRWMEGPADAIRAAQWAMVVVGIGVSLQFPLAIYTTVAHARERFEVENAIGIGARVTSALLTIWVLNNGWGVFGLACATMGAQVTGYLARMAAAYKLMPGIRWSPRLFSRGAVKEIVSFGAFSFLLTAADRVVSYFGPIIIGAFVGATAITYYALGGSLIMYYTQLVCVIVWTITPHATKLDAQGDRAALRALLYPSTRGVLFLASVITGGLCLLGHDFLALWMDPKYVSGELYTSSAVVLSILAVSTLVRYGQAAGRQIVFGMRKVRFLAALAGAEAVMNIVLSLLLVKPYGLLGVALATLIPVLLLHGIVQTVYVLRVLEADWRRYLRENLLACAPVLAAMAGMAWLANGWLVADTWLHFLAKAAVVVAPAPVFAFLFVLGPDQRGMLLRKMRLAS